MEPYAVETMASIMPRGWRVLPSGRSLRLIAPDAEMGKSWASGAKVHLKRFADRLGCDVLVMAGDRPISRIRASIQPSEPTPSNTDSWGASTIASDASYEEAADFMKGQRAQGRIVTVTGMRSNRCLQVNDLQVLDRGGGWSIDNWIGLNFLDLWRDSFQVGRRNYYGELIARLERDGNIPEYQYQIRRPSGALAEYSSTYFLLQDFCGTAVRIAVSTPGAWRIIEGTE